ncbi:amidase [Rhizobium wuzhouense]|uniref:Indoleacetamide hydrolase n=1 Tax=Rhizobium wuzhouense TaxID=1986026 RepID=A0ABX5NNG1_9HYPH|nr:amidase [Rhizobium wuzhouense]PYB71797.1 amidase [Rhizobium wuzhouense]
MINLDGQNGSAAETAFASMLALGADHGLTVAIKDCLDVAGHTTRCGSAAYADAAPALSNSAVVDRLLDAGCRIVGKTRLHEIAYGMTGVNAFEGTPVNPRWPDRIPGGSSSGSAVAVAAGSVDFAIGTDTGGSVRQPAICCGVIGFKPTFGRVDRRGAMPAASSLDCIGPLARSMDMIERAMEIIAPDYRVEMLTSTPRMALLVTDETDDPEMLEAHEALSLAGMVARRVHLADLDAAFRAGMAIIARETLDANRSRLEAGAPFGMDIRLRLEGARAISDAVLAAAEDIRVAFTQSVDDCLSEFDVIVTPALPQAPPLLSEAADPAKVLPLTRYLRPFNLSGHPAIVLPVVTSTGLPSGIQLIARKGADARLCAVARWLCDHHPMFSDLRGES